MNLDENTATSEEHVLVKQHNSQYNCAFYNKMNQDYSGTSGRLTGLIMLHANTNTKKIKLPAAGNREAWKKY